MHNYQAIGNADITAGASAYNVHDRYKDMTNEERCAVCREEALTYDVAIINVTGELNVGNIIRSASLCGARKVHILGRRKYDSRGEVGAANYIDVERVDMMDEKGELLVPDIKQYFYTNRLTPIFIEQDRRSFGLGMLPSMIKEATVEGIIPCVVFGNEGRGIPTELINMFTHPQIIQVVQKGVIRSFNVGSTAAIVLHAMMEAM